MRDYCFPIITDRLIHQSLHSGGTRIIWEAPVDTTAEPLPRPGGVWLKNWCLVPLDKPNA